MIEVIVMTVGVVGFMGYMFYRFLHKTELDLWIWSKINKNYVPPQE